MHEWMSHEIHTCINKSRVSTVATTSTSHVTSTNIDIDISWTNESPTHEWMSYELLICINDSLYSCQIRDTHVRCDVETLTRLCVRYDTLMSHVRYETRMSHVRYDSHDSWDESCDMWHVTCQMTCLSCKDPHETLMSDIIGWFVHWDTEGIEPTREQAPVSYGLRP